MYQIKKERLIHRSEYADYYKRNRINTVDKEHLYKRRQAIVEHPYGTIKWQWGFSYILMKKGISRASSDVGFLFISYNLRRIGNILITEVLKEYLWILAPVFLEIDDLLRAILMHFMRSYFMKIILSVKIEPLLKLAY